MRMAVVRNRVCGLSILSAQCRKGDILGAVLPPLPRHAVPLPPHTPLLGPSLPPSVGMPSVLWHDNRILITHILRTWHPCPMVARLVNLS